MASHLGVFFLSLFFSKKGSREKISAKKRTCFSEGVVGYKGKARGGVPRSHNAKHEEGYMRHTIN